MPAGPFLHGGLWLGMIPVEIWIDAAYLWPVRFDQAFVVA